MQNSAVKLVFIHHSPISGSTIAMMLSSDHYLTRPSFLGQENAMSAAFREGWGGVE